MAVRKDEENFSFKEGVKKTDVLVPPYQELGDIVPAFPAFRMVAISRTSHLEIINKPL